VEVAVVVLQKALLDSQLPDVLVLGDHFDRVLASCEIQLKRRVSQ